MKLGKKLIVTLTAMTLVTFGNIGSFCLAANSEKVVGQKIVKNDSSNKATEQRENDSNVKASIVDEKQLKEQLKKELSKIVEEIKKVEESEFKNSNSGSKSDMKCIVVDDEQIRKEIAKSHVMK